MWMSILWLSLASIWAFPVERERRNAVADPRKTWRNGVLPFEIENGFSHGMEKIIKDAIHKIESRTKVNGTKCITFIRRHGQTAYIRFERGARCHSSIGYTGSVLSVIIADGCERRGDVMHLLLHVLGFFHEENRPDRDDYVTIHLENIQTGFENKFIKYTSRLVDTLNQPYDYNSIMHSGAYAYSVNNSLQTIEPIQSSVQIGQRTRLSTTDIRKIQLLYKC